MNSSFKSFHSLVARTYRLIAYRLKCCRRCVAAVDYPGLCYPTTNFPVNTRGFRTTFSYRSCKRLPSELMILRLALCIIFTMRHLTSSLPGGSLGHIHCLRGMLWSSAELQEQELKLYAPIDEKRTRSLDLGSLASIPHPETFPSDTWATFSSPASLYLFAVPDHSVGVNQSDNFLVVDLDHHVGNLSTILVTTSVELRLILDIRYNSNAFRDCVLYVTARRIVPR